MVTAPAGAAIPEEVEIMKQSQQAARISSSGPQPRKAARKSAPRKAKGPTADRIARVKRPASRPNRSAPQEPRPSKQAEVIALLRRPEGTTVAEVIAATGWQPHTVRGLFSGTLKKKLGLALTSGRDDRGRVYRILEPAGRRTAGAHDGAASAT